MTEFEHVVGPLGQALNKREYTELTPVQEAVLAPELENADMLVSAQTGSGKTVAFGMALAPTLLAGKDRFERAKTPVALAIAPTRELALQVKRELEWLYEMTGATIASCVGGMDMRTERRNLAQGAHIVVGTPGRLRDHIERGSLNMTTMQAVVLDEADEMLDLGFRDDLEFILEAAPEERRTLMFSATVPRTIANLAKRYQRDAVRIATASDQKQHLDIQYRAFSVAANDRENAIINVLRFYEAKNAIVFCNTRATVNHMTARFSNRGFSVVALSGELSQNERTHALQAMRDGRARVCIATDVAARGIDLPNLELVIHADLPKNRESLLHRSGRTGRAGRKGVSVLIVPHNARRRTERLFDAANITADWAKPPSVDEVIARDNERILDDPSFSEPIKDEEREFIENLLSRHGPEQVAAAFARLYRANHSAPEELLDTPPPPQGKGRDRDRPQQARRDDFTDGVWFSVSVGRKHNAEPRWLLPMLCKAGGVTKQHIGAIRIDQTETYFELSPDSVDGFLELIGPSRKVEKNVTISRLDKKPIIPQRSQIGRKPRDDDDRKPGRDKPYGKRPPARDRKPARRGPPAENRPTEQHQERPVERRDERPAERNEERNYTPEADTAPARPPRPKRKKTKAPKLDSSGNLETPAKSKLSPAQKKRKMLKKKQRKQSR